MPIFKRTPTGKELFMITIYGKYTNAIVYTTNNEEYAIDDYARKQLQMICNHPSAAGSKIRVMPDVHAGKVGTIRWKHQEKRP